MAQYIGGGRLRFLIVGALVVGAALIGTLDPLLTTIGILATILGLMSLMFVVHEGLTAESPSDVPEPPAA